MLKLRRKLGRQMTLRVNPVAQLHPSLEYPRPRSYQKDKKKRVPLVNLSDNNPTTKLKVVSESESDIDLSATKGKRSASEMGFDIPPAKRPEPEEGSVTESESDFDMQPSSRPPPISAPLVTGNAVAHCDAGWCSPSLTHPQERSVGSRPQMTPSQNRSLTKNSPQTWLVPIRGLDITY